MKWCNSTRKYYESLGYIFTKYNDEFVIDIKDLPLKSETVVTCICEKCRKERETTYRAYNHITQQQSKPYICRECFIENKILKYDVIKNEVEKSGYILLTEQSLFTNGNTMIEYLCPKHGKQCVRASNFHNGRRCPKCKADKAHDRYAFSQEQVTNIVNNLGGTLLNPNEYKNNSEKNLRILCCNCKTNIFITSLSSFVNHSGQVCKDCSNKESSGERKVRKWLESHNISFEQEKFFKDCKDKKQLPFDFYLPDLNTIIEYDGKQHYENGHFFTNKSIYNGMSVTEYTKYHDSIKNKYCQDNNISLIRIPYTQFNNIEKILEERLIA